MRLDCLVNTFVMSAPYLCFTSYYCLNYAIEITFLHFTSINSAVFLLLYRLR